MTWNLFITKDRASFKTEYGIELLEFERDYHDNWHVRIPHCRSIVSAITNLKTTTIQVHDVRNQ